MASRRAIVTFEEMEIPPAPTNRRIQISWVEMEIPDLPRRLLLGWEEMEIPDEGAAAPQTDFIGSFGEASEAVAGLATIDENPQTHPYLQALSASLKKIAAQGEPVTTTSVGSPGKMAKFAGSTRLADSIASEVAGTLSVAGSISATGAVTGSGEVRSMAGSSVAALSATSGGGSAPAVSLRTGGATRAILGVPTVAGELMGGSVPGDLIIRTQGGAIRFTVNSGGSQIAAITQAAFDHGSGYRVAGIQVLGPRKTGYTPMSGTANASASFDTATVTTAQLAQRVKAIQDDLMLHGALGI